MVCLILSHNAKISSNVPEKKHHTKETATPLNEVRLRHLTRDEASLKLDQFLHDAYMAGLYQVRVIHGKGTGTLRQMVARQLATHPLVKSYRPGEYGEGGAGVTIAALSEK